MTRRVALALLAVLGLTRPLPLPEPIRPVPPLPTPGAAFGVPLHEECFYLDAKGRLWRLTGTGYEAVGGPTA